MDERLAALYDDVDEGLFRSDAEPDRAPQEWLDAASELLTPTLGRAIRREDAKPADPSQSLLGAIVAARIRRHALASSKDVASLAATTRGGSLLDRRAALIRLVALAEGDEKILDKVSFEGIHHEPELGADLLRVQAKRRGAPGRETRATLGQVKQHLRRFEELVTESVEGATTVDALNSLDPRDRARLMLHHRDLSDLAAAFVADRIESSVKTGNVLDACDLITALRPAADPRMLPLLAAALLDDPRSEVRAEAARSIARIDDRRVVPLLYDAYSRASDLGERLALAEALALWGDFRGSEAVTSGLADPSDETKITALEALFDPELAEKAVQFARAGDHHLRHAAFRALARSGDVGALEWLDRIEAEADELSPSLVAELKSARATLLARAEMRGESTQTALEQAKRIAGERSARVLVREPGAPPTKRHRFGAWLLMARALVAQLLGRREAASDLAERALEADPGWFKPALVQGHLWHKQGDPARALAGFRRALSLAPARIATRSSDMERIAMTYVARAEQLHEAGRVDVARTLIDELMQLDLSHVPSHVRIAVRRRRRKLERPALMEAT